MPESDEVVLTPRRLKPGETLDPDRLYVFLGGSEMPDSRHEIGIDHGSAFTAGDWYVPIRIAPPEPEPIQVIGCAPTEVTHLASGLWECMAWIILGEAPTAVLVRHKDKRACIEAFNLAAQKLNDAGGV